ncbi:hypothetical protein HBI75_080050 [Parastagonospora nodorum]|nr:hypothetical protein HBI75_080050 [Parastagonospora nodorum]KAH5677288.1 hypothetical protein HBI21_100720 [Parastagonospora nodorum]
MSPQLQSIATFRDCIGSQIRKGETSCALLRLGAPRSLSTSREKPYSRTIKSPSPAWKLVTPFTQPLTASSETPTLKSYLAMYQYIKGTLSLSRRQLSVADPMRRTMRSSIDGKRPINPIGDCKPLRGQTNQHHYSNDRDQTCRGGTGRLINHGSYTMCGVRRTEPA